MKMIAVLVVIFVFTLIFCGCVKSSPQDNSSGTKNKWKICKDWAELWLNIKSEKVESIISCDGDSTTDIESWYLLDKIPPDQLQMFTEFIGEEANGGIKPASERHFRRTCQGMLKVVTDKGKYVAPFDGHTPENNWQERVTLVGLWPRLHKEEIKSISFCNEHLIANIDSWQCWDVPKERLDECIKLLDKAMQSADPNNFDEMAVNEGRMKIFTNKGKYLVKAEASESKVNGNEWVSPELGMFLKNCGFPTPDANSIKQ
jgi:hypothetical protein